MNSITKKTRIKKTIKYTVSVLSLFLVITYITAEFPRYQHGAEYYGFPFVFYTKNDPWNPITWKYIFLVLDFTFVVIVFQSFVLISKYILGNIWKKLNSITPKSWGIIYLSLIPIYAFIYTLLPNSFYNNSNQFEKLNPSNNESLSIKYKLTDDIGETLLTNFNDYYNCGFLIGNKGDTIHNPIRWFAPFLPVEVVGPNLVFTVMIIDNEDHSGSIILKIPIDGNIGSRRMTMDSTRSDISKFNFEIKKLFPTLRSDYNKNYYPKSRFMTIPINSRLQNEINSFVYGVNGVSRRDFMNMFYLSTVIITTLGFGDIVPITKLARFVVSSEAILGVLIVGLFLNSISKTNASNRDE